MAEIVKCPAGGAYGEWFRANRAEIAEKAKAAGDTKMTDVAKKASETWKAMSDTEKEPWVKKYEEHKAAFEAYKNSDGYVAPERKSNKRKQGDEPAPAKDPHAPKKPVGGAYGVFANEKREEFAKQAAATGDAGFGAGAKLASAAWKELGAEERASYQAKYEEAKAKYEKDLAEYRAAHPVVSPAKSSPDAKRARPSGGAAKASATKGKKASPKSGAADPAGIPEDVLEAAESLGYRSQLVNLASRAEITSKGCSGQALLDALKGSNGLVNKAKAAILAGA
jgi:hypothetical protein